MQDAEVPQAKRGGEKGEKGEAAMVAKLDTGTEAKMGNRGNEHERAGAFGEVGAQKGQVMDKLAEAIEAVETLDRWLADRGWPFCYVRSLERAKANADTVGAMRTEIANDALDATMTELGRACKVAEDCERAEAQAQIEAAIAILTALQMEGL